MAAGKLDLEALNASAARASKQSIRAIRPGSVRCQGEGRAMQKSDLLFATTCEAVLIFIVAIAGWMAHQPLVFASLGPTAYELIETPERKTARPYNVIVGHLIGVLAGFAGLYAAHAFNSPEVATEVTLHRAVAAALAAGLTVFFTLLLKASQPAAVSTALLIALGTLQLWRDAFVIMGAVLLMLVFGEPLRMLRLRQKQKREQQQQRDR
jgi:CBS-domain-containing membrane protein